MPYFEIGEKDTGNILYRGEATSLASLVEQAVIEGASLRSAYLRGVDLRGRVLRRADLRWAVLADANMREVDLREADLSDADLYQSDLYNARLYRAKLIRTVLRMADMHYADVTEANMTGADLRGATLYGMKMPFALLTGVEGASAPVVPNIDAAILATVRDGKGRLEMYTWHICATTHCRAGWAITLAGLPGKMLEERIGSAAAGALIYAASRPGKPIPDFYANNEEAIADMEAAACQTV